MKLFASLCKCLVFFCVSEGFLRNIHFKIKTDLKSINSSDWTLPELYGPPRFIPLVPYSLVKSLMISKYTHSLSKECDMSLKLCEEFRRKLKENMQSYKVPKARYGLIGNDFLIGFIAVRKNDTTVISMESILPLYHYQNTDTNNITIIKQLFTMQYESCFFNTTLLSPYWQHVFHLYDCYQTESP